MHQSQTICNKVLRGVISLELHVELIPSNTVGHGPLHKDKYHEFFILMILKQITKKTVSSGARQKKRSLGFPALTQTGLCSYKRWLEALYSGFRQKSNVAVVRFHAESRKCIFKV